MPFHKDFDSVVFAALLKAKITIADFFFGSLQLSAHCVHNRQQPYDEMHQGHWLNVKFGFPQTGK